MKHLLTRPVFAPADPPAAPPATPPATPPAPPPAAPPAPAAPAADPPANALARDPAAAPVASPADWPADWREKAAIGADGKVDAKELERLKRLDSPVALYKSYRELEARVTSGKLKDDVPMPTDEAGAKAWREERGIPADPTGYVLPEAVTKVLTPEDAPVLANFTTYAHKNGMSPKAVEQGVAWYAGLVEEQRVAQETADKAAADATEDALRKEWGEGFRDNQLMARKFSAEAVPGVEFFYARLPNDPEKFGDNAGKTLGNIPGVVQALTQLGLLKYGDVSFAGGEAAKATEGRIAELKNIMDTDFDKWNASPALRTEYFGLLEKQQKKPGAAA